MSGCPRPPLADPPVAHGLRGALLLSLGLLGSGALTGCAALTDNFVQKKVLPTLMADDDVELACMTGAATAPMLAVIGPVGNHPTKAGVLTQLSAGMCAEFRAWDAELLRLQANYEGRSTASQDHLEVERRAHVDAARRYYASWRSLEAAFGEIGGECPTLRANDEAVYLLGLSAGVLSVLHDRAGGNEIDVPLDIPAKVGRGAACLDDDAWWGVPGALQAAVAISIPGGVTAGSDPFAALELQALKGERAKVRLARSFQIQTLSSQGKEEELGRALAAHATALGTPADPAWRLLDRYGGLLIRHESDKRWMQETGARTPQGSFGSLPGAVTQTLDLLEMPDLFGPLPIEEVAPAPTGAPSTTPHPESGK